MTKSKILQINPTHSWRMDEYSFIHTPSEFFPISKLDMLRKDGDKTLFFHVNFTIIKHEFSLSKDRDDVYKMLVGARTELVIKEQAHYKQHHDYSEKVLAAQQKMVGLIGKCDKPKKGKKS